MTTPSTSGNGSISASRPARARRAARTPAEWRKIVKAWRGSGMPAKDYAALHGLGAASLWKWAARFPETLKAAVTAPAPAVRALGVPASPRLVVVGEVARAVQAPTTRASEESCALELVTRGGHVLKLKGGVDPQFVGALLAALDGGRQC